MSDVSVDARERLARVMDQCGRAIDAAAREVEHSRAILARSSQQTRPTRGHGTSEGGTASPIGHLHEGDPGQS
jgi:hypothetical protein